MEPKVIEVEEPVLRAVEAAARALSKAAGDAIKAVDPEASIPVEFERTDPIECATSLLKTAEQRIGVLAGLGKKAVDDGEKAAALATKLSRLLKGDKACQTCKAAGKDHKGRECADCDGQGFAPASAA